MSDSTASQLMNKSESTTLHVAIAVIYYQTQYLLGFRHSTQHQGNRYEFIGGKIESHEDALAALVREVHEETGIDITDNTLIKLGRLLHDYGDKKVCLHVYSAALNKAQYQQHATTTQGLEGQALCWVNKDKLIANHYPLPAANQTILQWLQLPEHLVITYPVQTHLIDMTSDVDKTSDIIEPEHSLDPKTWLSYHQKQIKAGAWTYIRPKMRDASKEKGVDNIYSDFSLSRQLMRLRPDIKSVVNITTYNELQQQDKRRITAVQLSHQQLMQSADSATQDQYAKLPQDKPLIISCHDKDSIAAANTLATQRVEHALPAVIAIFISPILATKTHPDAQPLGWTNFADLAQHANMPVVGLGGLSPIFNHTANTHGAAVIAGIRGFVSP